MESEYYRTKRLWRGAKGGGRVGLKESSWIFGNPGEEGGRGWGEKQGRDGAQSMGERHMEWNLGPINNVR